MKSSREICETSRIIQYKNEQSRKMITEKRELRQLIPAEAGSNMNPIRIVGRGEYGLVFEATTRTAKHVAVKRIVYAKDEANREEEILRMLDNPNVIHLLSVFHAPGPSPLTIYIFFVTELMPMTLRAFMKEHTPVEHIFALVYAFQMFAGLAHIHGRGVMHRDMSPDNLVVDPSTGKLKIIDFGFAKVATGNSESVPYLTERPYRAPEMIYGCKKYHTPVDVWAAACIFAELLRGKPLFSGVSQEGVAQDMARIIGPPSHDVLAKYHGTAQILLPRTATSSLEKELPNANHDEIELLKKCLQWDPEKRPTAQEILQSKCFDELFTGFARLPGRVQLPPLSRATI